MNKNILTQVGKTLNRTEIVIAVKSYNSVKEILDGHEVFIFSDKATGTTFYSNGKILAGRYNPSGKCSMDFVINENNNLPWVREFDMTLKYEIKNVTSKLLKDNPCILARHKAVKLLIANYEDFLSYCISSKYMKFDQLNHLVTKMKFKETDFGTAEVAVAIDKKEEIPMPKPEHIETKPARDPAVKIRPMNIAHKLRKKYMSDAEFASYDYRLQMKICLKEAWIIAKDHNGVAKEVAPEVEKKVVNPIPPVTTTEIPKAQILKDRVPGYYYITFKPGYVYVEDCSGQILKTFEGIKDQVINKEKLTEKDVIWTERMFLDSYVSRMPLEFIVLHTKDNKFARQEGRTYHAIC